jgi:hypothetical protein
MTALLNNPNLTLLLTPRRQLLLTSWTQIHPILIQIPGKPLRHSWRLLVRVPGCIVRNLLCPIIQHECRTRVVERWDLFKIHV